MNWRMEEDGLDEDDVLENTNFHWLERFGVGARRLAPMFENDSKNKAGAVLLISQNFKIS